MNIRLLLVLLLGLCCPVWAAVEATPLPEVVQHDFYRQVWVAAGNLTVLGIIGLFVCTANKVKLHNGLGDIYLSAPVSLVCWAGLAWLLYMGYRGDDMLPYLESRLWVAGCMVGGPMLYALVMARRCNPECGWFVVLMAGITRLVADMLYQLCSILLLIGLLLTILRGTGKEGQKSGILGLLASLLGISFLQKMVWDAIRSTTREPIEGSGALVAFLHMLCFAGSIYGVYTYVQHNPQQKAVALVQAVEANQPQRAMELMALNPMMSLDAGIRAAVEARNYTMLNHVVRGTGDLNLALQYAEEMQLTSVKKFLMKKAPASDK